MLRNEWSLIINSLLVQLASGIFIFSAIYQTILPGSTDSKSAMFIAGPIILLGMIISLFHLGNPFRAYRSISNLISSWLSREVFFTSIFFGLWVVYFVLDMKGSEIQSVVWLVIGAGVLSIISMANIYRFTGKPGWAGLSTYIGFFPSILILGCIGSAAVLVYNGTVNREVSGLLVPAIVITLIILALRLVQQLLLVNEFKKENNEWSLDQLVSVPPLNKVQVSRYRKFILSGWFLSFAGLCAALAVFAFGSSIPVILFVVPVVAVFIGELLSRCGFYLLGVE